MADKTKTIDEYLRALSNDQRVALQKLRKTIKSAASSKAEECNSATRSPAFRLNEECSWVSGQPQTHCAFLSDEFFHGENHTGRP